MNQDSPVAADSAATIGAERRPSDSAPQPEGASESGSDGSPARSGNTSGGATGTGSAQAPSASRRPRTIEERLRLRFRRCRLRRRFRAPGLPVRTSQDPGTRRPRSGPRQRARPTTDPRRRPPPGLRASRPLVQHPERERTPGPAPRLPTPRPRIRQRRPWMDRELRPPPSAVAVEEAEVGEAEGALVLPTRTVPTRTVPTRTMREAEKTPATRWIARRHPVATAATGRPLPRRPATGSPGGPRSTSAPMTRRRSIPPRTPSATTRSPTARSRRPRVRGSAGVDGGPAPPSGRRALRATEPRSRPRTRRRRAGPAPGRTRSRSRPEAPREGCVPAVRARVASAEDVAAARTRSWCRGSPTRSW